jgi:hypothetical protein
VLWVYPSALVVMDFSALTDQSPGILLSVLV